MTSITHHMVHRPLYEVGILHYLYCKGITLAPSSRWWIGVRREKEQGDRPNEVYCRCPYEKRVTSTMVVEIAM